MNNPCENLAILQRVVKYLNEDGGLPKVIDGRHIVYRLYVTGDSVKVEGFMPKADANSLINPKLEQINSGILWVAAQGVAYDDYVLRDGDANDLAPLYRVFRDCAFLNFFVNYNEPVFSRELYGALIDGVFVAEEVL